MSKGVAFWIIWLVSLLCYLWFSWPLGQFGVLVLVFFVLAGLVGWAVFGGMIK